MGGRLDGLPTTFGRNTTAASSTSSHATVPLVADHLATLDIIGLGPEQPRLEAMGTSLNIKHKVQKREELMTRLQQAMEELASDPER